MHLRSLEQAHAFAVERMKLATFSVVAIAHNPEVSTVAGIKAFGSANSDDAEYIACAVALMGEQFPIISAILRHDGEIVWANKQVVPAWAQRN